MLKKLLDCFCYWLCYIAGRLIYKKFGGTLQGLGVFNYYFIAKRPKFESHLPLLQICLILVPSSLKLWNFEPTTLRFTSDTAEKTEKNGSSRQERHDSLFQVLVSLIVCFKYWSLASFPQNLKNLKLLFYPAHLKKCRH